LCQQCLDNPNINIELARERLLTHLGQQSLSMKEVRADEVAVAAGFKSRSQVIRERGGNPLMVGEQIAAEQPFAKPE